MNWIDDWRERRDHEWAERWNREHRWDALGTYNAERYRGLVHTPEYDARMAEEQRRFNEEAGQSGRGFPVTLGPAP